MLRVNESIVHIQGLIFPCGLPALSPHVSSRSQMAEESDGDTLLTKTFIPRQKFVGGGDGNSEFFFFLNVLLFSP